jgi:RND family efflux transporter MFP subunit
MITSGRLLQSFVLCTMPVLAGAQMSDVSKIDYATVGLSPATAVLGGFTTCRAELDLAFAVSGLVETTLVEEGTLVKRGDVLMRLDQEIERIELLRRQSIMEDDAELRAAMARADIALRQKEAAERLHETTGGISREEVQNRTLAHELAVIEISRLEAQAKINALDYSTALENLVRRTLVAPSNGIISKIEIQTGESAQANDPVMMLCDLSQLKFSASIPVKVADGLSKGMKVAVQISSRNTTIDGTVDFVSPVVDSASGLQEIKVLINQTHHWLRPGMKAVLVVNF